MNVCESERYIDMHTHIPSCTDPSMADPFLALETRILQDEEEEEEAAGSFFAILPCGLHTAEMLPFKGW